MKRIHVILALVGLAALGAGGFVLVKWLNRPKIEQAQPVPPPPRERTSSASVPAITFTDVTASSGVRFHHEAGFSGQKLLPETMGGGVACFDYDGDGKPDILFVNGRVWPGFDSPTNPPATLKLYRNLGDFKFEDVTDAVGLNVILYGMGVAVGDFDNDGFPDIFVSCVGKHRLFRNLGGKRFEDVTDAAGVGGPGELPDVKKDEFLAWKPPIPFGSSATFIDYDGDGKLDLFVCHYVTWSPSIDRNINSTLEGGKRTFVQPKDFDGSQCTLYRNVDGKRFVDVSKEAGVLVTQKEGTDPNAPERPVGKALGVVLCDADGDGWPDLIVANDSVRNFFFHNVEKGGKRVFEEKGYPLGAAYADGGVARAGMGIDWAEFAPGRVAAVIANYTDEPLTFLEKDRGRLAFTDISLGVGLVGPSRAALKFGTIFFDYDNDGRLDLLVCNGHIEPEVGVIKANQAYAQPVQLYWNTGDPQCYFEPVTAERAGAALFKPQVGRGCAFADFNGDGNLDLVLVGNGGEARVLRNDAPKTNHFIKLDLRGDGVTSNRSALGAQVTIEAGGQKLVRQITGGRGYLSQSELVLNVGLGSATKVDKVTVRWPGKAAGTETWATLDADKTHALKQGEAK